MDVVQFLNEKLIALNFFRTVVLYPELILRIGIVLFSDSSHHVENPMPVFFFLHNLDYFLSGEFFKIPDDLPEFNVFVMSADDQMHMVGHKNKPEKPEPFFFAAILQAVPENLQIFRFCKNI